MKCIICNQEKEDDELSIEHVIPESAGSSFTINCVCKECNNRLGQTIDKKFLDNKLVKFYLYSYDIKNKKGRFPKFWNTLPAKDNPKIKAIPQYNSRNNKFEGWKYKSVLSNNNGNMELIFDSSEDIEDVLKEFDLPDEVLEEIINKHNSGDYVRKNHKLDLRYGSSREDLFFEAIKIAYEYAYYIFGDEYLLDSFASEFREILLNPNKFSINEIKKYFINYDFGESKFKNTLHDLNMIRFENSIVVNINLFDCFNFCVEVSKNLNLFPPDIIVSFLLIGKDTNFDEYNIDVNFMDIDFFKRFKDIEVKDNIFKY